MMASVLPLLLGSSIITAATPTNKTLPHLMFILQDDLYVHNDKARIIKLTPTTGSLYLFTNAFPIQGCVRQLLQRQCGGVQHYGQRH